MLMGLSKQCNACYACSASYNITQCRHSCCSDGWSDGASVND